MSRNASIAFLAAVALQIVGLLAFAAAKSIEVSRGTEVVLQQARPVDPLSLMQGEYAILDYEIAVLPDERRHRFEPGDEVIVVLEKRGNVWEGARYLDSDRLPREKGDLFIRGELQTGNRIDFGIGTYFVPEGTGHAIEEARDVKIRVSVTRDGDATVTGVILDGEDFDP